MQARRVAVTYGRPRWAGVLARMPSVCAGYRPPFYLVGGLLQTVSTALMPAPAGLDWRREELPLPELSRPAGASCCPAVVPVGLVSLDWLDHPELPAEAAAAVPIVLVIPGLTGDSSASYVARFDPEL
jgi:predicted alpha/beta-fold hydrolase